MSDDQLKARLLERTRQMLEARVEEVMTRDVTTVDAGDLSAKAARLILENGFLGVLVMKDGRPLNMITAFELLRLGYEEVFDPARDYLRLTCEKVVAGKEFIHVPTGTPLREALNIMMDRQVRTIPVIDDGVVQGIVSLIDMARWYRDTHEEVRTGRLGS
ncbi:MAG: CBS domain-containing protein [Spirochaetales bacterium]|nr:CBS domain-containing protein [Leptospiraceae bacterium]MCP5482719.1 CBS domain-containing protein [Spirochaetales bacterium]MCP5485213.1 CBS domain-containing protein [Spirochaetales bacterium]